MNRLLHRFSTLAPRTPSNGQDDYASAGQKAIQPSKTSTLLRRKKSKEHTRAASLFREEISALPDTVLVTLDANAGSQTARAVPCRVAGSSLPPAASMILEDLSDKESAVEAVEIRAPSPLIPAPKMVLFAPSPEKQRTRSPVSLLSSQTNLKHPSYAGSNTFTSSFAKPTVASQNRIRPTARASLESASERDVHPRRPRHLPVRSQSYVSTPTPRKLTVPGSSTDAISSTLEGRLSLDALNSSSNRDTPEPRRSNSPLSFPRRSSMREHGPRLVSSDIGFGLKSDRLLPPVTLNAYRETLALPLAGKGPRCFGGPTWSEMTQQDLVKNLSPRERTRQEVLWEIVASEERYFAELLKAKVLYLDVLLGPHSFNSNRDSHKNNAVQSRQTHVAPPANASANNLPIAARYMEKLSKQPSTASSRVEASAPESLTDAAISKGKHGSDLGHSPVADRASLDRTAPATQFRVRTAVTGSLGLTVPLPPSLKEVLTAISDGLLQAHETLSDALKARYQEQWPLVRSLADVFMAQSHMLQHYASYVCHLRRAMEEIEEAALMERAFRGKKLRKDRVSNTVGLGRTVAALQASAAEGGFPGLCFFVSMPFQRLLKYPLLFQNLLYHTDPSTHEFESTVAMVVEVERMVRSIEDEKINIEERDKARDAFARINGITNKQVLKPKADRILIEERGFNDLVQANKGSPENKYVSDNDDTGNESDIGRSRKAKLRDASQNKRSLRRLSSFLSSEASATKKPEIGSKKDLWLIRFSDVEIKCQRTGVTSLPMTSTAALTGGHEQAEESSFDEKSRDSRDRLKALRNSTLRAKTRNLYKFVSVVAWKQAKPNASLSSLPQSSFELVEEDESDDRSSVYSSSSDATDSSHEGIGRLPASDKYIRSTKLSFTYLGDRLELTAPDAQSSTTRLPRPRPSTGTEYSHSSTRSVSGRITEPMAATSMVSASQTVQNVVAQMHARQRNQKFGGRMRPFLDPSTKSTTSVVEHYT